MQNLAKIISKYLVNWYVIFQVRWGDAHDGYGEQYWEYNHGPKQYGKEVKYKPAASEAKPVYEPKPVYASNSL